MEYLFVSINSMEIKWNLWKKGGGGVKILQVKRPQVCINTYHMIQLVCLTLQMKPAGEVSLVILD